MNRMQFMLSLGFMGMMSLVGSFIAVFALQGEPVQAQKDAAGPVRGTEFQLVDKDGNVRADLSLDDDGEVMFTMTDTGGKGRVQLNSGGKRAYMALLDDKGMVRYIVGQDDTTVMQTFADGKGNNRMIQSFKNSGELVMSFIDPEGEALMSLTAGPEAASTLILTDPTGKNRVTMFAKDDQSSLNMNAGDGNFLAAVLGDGRPVFALSKAEKLRLRAMLKENGEPEFMFLNEERESTWKAGK
ncbi:MAG: hypothetical protein K8I27_14965 [Planctomycetes bacterium]|nr:hypothetical protein [Planctomycetota bacterium]